MNYLLIYLLISVLALALIHEADEFTRNKTSFLVEVIFALTWPIWMPFVLFIILLAILKIME